MKQLTCRKGSHTSLPRNRSRRRKSDKVNKTGGNKKELAPSSADELGEGSGMNSMNRYFDNDDRSFKTFPPIM